MATTIHSFQAKHQKKKTAPSLGRIEKFLLFLAICLSFAAILVSISYPSASPNLLPPSTEIRNVQKKESDHLLEFEEDAQSRQKIVPLRTQATKQLAQQCVKAGQGGIYIKHFRKAGGTSLTTALKQYTCIIRRIPSFVSEFPFFKQETFKSLGTSIFITSLRHPVDRIISLYWFEGRWPRTCNKLCEDRKEKTNATKVADLEEWIEHVHDQTNATKLSYTRHNACGQWNSVENYYIRMLLGVDAIGRDRSKKTTKHRRGFMNVTLTRDHLHRAKEILASFDLVMIQEQMSSNSNSCSSLPSLTNRMFHDLTGPPGRNTDYDHLLANRRKGAEREKYFQPPSDAALKRLYEWNALDIELYEFAVKLNARIVQEWETTTSRQDNATANFDSQTACRKPPFVLSNDVFDIALGGNYCCPGKYCGVTSRSRGFYINGKQRMCTLQSNEPSFK